MSFFDKALSKVGIGAAKVDARIEDSHVVAGDEQIGAVHISGGNVVQEISKIY